MIKALLLHADTKPGESSRPCALRCRRRLLRHDEQPEQQAPGHRLHRLWMHGEKVVADEALLLVPDQAGLQHLLAALRARHPRGGTAIW